APPIPHTDVPDAERAIAEIGEAKRVAVLWDGVDLQAARALLGALPKGLELSTYIAGEQGNARGAEALGMLPRDGGKSFGGMIDDARAGRLRVLSIFGANPVLQYPDGAAVREALAKTPFVVVSDLFMTQTADLATLVLPAKGSFEKTGTTTNLEGELLPVNAAMELEAPAGALSDLEMLVALAERLGVRLPASDELDAAVIAGIAAIPDGYALGDARFGSDSGVPHVEDGELRLTVQSNIFAGGGTVAHDARIAALRPLPQAALSPADAARLGLETGDYVDLESDDVTLADLLVEVRPGMQPGTLALIGGLPDGPANALSSGSARVVNVRKTGALELEGAR
ncbi:MAG: molybdopterin-dependent oxidoreductase, partial [Candidatus Eremiobacteraeota bacterium]|nr:molybdopterin-dependent oxidoreductase [Candidatus Eremiobacteraeota bacterium]